MFRSFWVRLLAIACLSVWSAGVGLAQGDLGNVEGAGAGDGSLLCTALGAATHLLAKDAEHTAARAQEEAESEHLMALWAEMLTETELETGVPLSSVDPAALAAVMAEIEAEAQGPEPAAAEDPAQQEQWTSFDIARTALSVASIADPTGAVGIAAAYTYPVCGRAEALQGNGGFCWKHSEERGVGAIPADLGRVADCPAGQVNFGLSCSGGGNTIAAPSQLAVCPAGYRNTGAFCTRGTDDIAAPSRVASCPEGFQNTGLSCLRPASTYAQGSRMADCPAGYTNLGATCTRGADSYTKACTFITKHPCRAGYTDMGCHCQRWADTQGLSAMSCSAGEFRSGGRCYQQCRPGYTNNGEFCGRGAQTVGAGSMSCPAGYFLNPSLGRCYQSCPNGYTNTGETCHRPLATLSTAAMSCPTGYFLNAQLGRCYKTCPQGFSNTGETCFQPVNTGGLEAMSCRASEFFSAGRCYDQAACAAKNGPNGKAVMDLGLCYPACKTGEQGIGPVCWTACGGKLAEECAAGCAATTVDCALATTDMAASPLEMVASIVSLGGYSAAKSARKAASVATRQGVKQGVQLGAQRLAQGSLREALSEAAQAGSQQAAEAAGRTLAQRFARTAKSAAAKTARTARHIDTKYTELRNKVLAAVFQPVIDAAKRAGTPIAEKAKAGWAKVKAELLRGEPQRKAWKRVHPEGQATYQKVLREMMAIRRQAKSNAVVRAESLARSCSKLGLKVDQAMLE